MTQDNMNEIMLGKDMKHTPIVWNSRPISIGQRVRTNSETTQTLFKALKNQRKPCQWRTQARKQVFNRYSEGTSWMKAFWIRKVVRKRVNTLMISSYAKNISLSTNNIDRAKGSWKHKTSLNSKAQNIKLLKLFKSLQKLFPKVMKSWLTIPTCKSKLTKADYIFNKKVTGDMVGKGFHAMYHRPHKILNIWTHMAHTKKKRLPDTKKLLWTITMATNKAILSPILWTTIVLISQ